MRRAGGALAGLALLLAACGSAAEPAEIRVSGKFGTIPAVEFSTPIPIEAGEAHVLTAGSGPVVGDGAPVVLTLTAFSGDDGTLLEGAGTTQVLFATQEDLGETLLDAVLGVHEGTRLLLTQPVLGGSDREMVVTVVDVIPTRAVGSTSIGDERITVRDGADGAPEISIPHETMPTGSLEILQISRGEGEQVTMGQRVVVQYTVWHWSDGSVFDTTWETGVPAVLELDSAFPGVQMGLVDQPVGSRVLLEIPPVQGLGTDTLVMVADILAATD
nr:hypothetical protein [Actinomycetales bacterium]